MKKELKHLAPYLPYELKYIDKDTGELKTMRSISTEINMIDFGWGNAHDLKEFKPILRPLSDLTKEIEVNGEKFIPSWIFDELNSTTDSSAYLNTEISRTYFDEFSSKHREHHLDFMPFGMINSLFEWHFDVFGLIDKGLAIDIKTLNK